METHDKNFKKIIEKQNQEIQRLKADLALERKKSNQENRNERYFEYILANVPCHVYWLNEKNVYLGCNDIHARNAGYKSRKDIVGKKNIDLNWRNQAEELDQINIQAMQSGNPVNREESFIVTPHVIPSAARDLPALAQSLT